MLASHRTSCNKRCPCSCPALLKGLRAAPRTCRARRGGRVASASCDANIYTARRYSSAASRQCDVCLRQVRFSRRQLVPLLNEAGVGAARGTQRAAHITAAKDAVTRVCESITAQHSALRGSWHPNEEDVVTKPMCAFRYIPAPSCRLISLALRVIAPTRPSRRRRPSRSADNRQSWQTTPSNTHATQHIRQCTPLSPFAVRQVGLHAAHNPQLFAPIDPFSLSTSCERNNMSSCIALMVPFADL